MDGDPTQDFAKYLARLSRYSNGMRACYTKGEASYNDVVGLDTFEGIRVKNEPPQGRGHEARVKRDVNALAAINAMRKDKRDSKSKDGSCWSCGAAGHFQAQCPRGTSGLATNVVQTKSNPDDGDANADLAWSTADEQTEDPAVSAVRHPRAGHRPRVRFQGRKSQGRRQSPRFRRNRRVLAVLEEQDDGSAALVQPDDADNEDEAEDAPEEEDSVHFLA